MKSAWDTFNETRRLKRETPRRETASAFAEVVAPGWLDTRPQPRSLTGFFHRANIRLLVKAGCTAGRFWVALKKALGTDYDELAGFPHFHPDAFQIDSSSRRVSCFEVEDAHPIDAPKLRQYVDLWYALDFLDWTVTLTRVDKWGTQRPVDLLVWALEFSDSAEWP